MDLQGHQNYLYSRCHLAAKYLHFIYCTAETSIDSGHRGIHLGLFEVKKIAMTFFLTLMPELS